MNTTHTTTDTKLFDQCKELASAFTETERDAVRMAELACKIATARDLAPCVAVDYARSQTIARDNCRGDLNRGLISCYVGTYAKYNDGNLDGCWISLDGYEDAEYLLDCMRGLHEDEADPEIMLQDWNINLDGTGITAADLGETPSLDTLQSLLDLLNADEYERELALDYLNARGEKLSDYTDFSDLLSSAEDACAGTLDKDSWNPFRDWAVQMFLECNDVPAHLENYLDADYIAREYSWDTYEGDKFVFWAR